MWEWKFSKMIFKSIWINFHTTLPCTYTSCERESKCFSKVVCPKAECICQHSKEGPEKSDKTIGFWHTDGMGFFFYITHLGIG